MKVSIDMCPTFVAVVYDYVDTMTTFIQNHESVIYSNVKSSHRSIVVSVWISDT